MLVDKVSGPEVNSATSGLSHAFHESVCATGNADSVEAERAGERPRGRLSTFGVVFHC